MMDEVLLSRRHAAPQSSGSIHFRQRAVPSCLGNSTFFEVAEIETLPTQVDPRNGRQQDTTTMRFR